MSPTYRRGPLKVGTTLGVADAAGDAEAEVDASGGVEDERFVPPTTPPTTAATMTRARTSKNSTQKCRLRNPHILRGSGFGGWGPSSSIDFSFAGVIGVSGTTVVPAIADVNVESIGDSIDVGESADASSTRISFS